MDINNCVLGGRLTCDSELSYTQQNNTAMSKFRLAVNDRRKKDQATFVNVVCFGKQAEALNEFLTVGKTVCVVGKLEIRPYKDADDNRRESVSVIADQIILGPKKHAEVPA